MVSEKAKPLTDLQQMNDEVTSGAAARSAILMNEFRGARRPHGYDCYVFSAGDVAEHPSSSADRGGRYSSAIVCRASACGLRQAQCVSNTEHSEREAGASTK